MIIKDDNGNEFLELIEAEEETVETYFSPVNHALVIVKLGEDYLMGYNHWCKDWEIFGGCKEENESIRECAKRECFEELGIKDEEFHYLGLMKFHMAPGYFNPEWHVEYGGLYAITIPENALNQIERYRQDKEEIEQLALYGKLSKSEQIAKIDEALLQFWK